MSYRVPFIFFEFKGSEVTMTPDKIVYFALVLQSTALVVNQSESKNVAEKAMDLRII